MEGAAPESFVIGESDTEATDVEKTSDFQNSPPLFSEYSVYICYLDSFYYRSFSFRINIKALLRTFKKEKKRSVLNKRPYVNERDAVWYFCLHL